MSSSLADEKTEWFDATNTGETAELFYSPANKEYRKAFMEYICFILDNYDVDGLHIDDYFYPTTDASFDSAAFGESGYSVLSDFRFANCDRLVSSIYSAVKSANPTALLNTANNNFTNKYLPNVR